MYNTEINISAKITKDELTPEIVINKEIDSTQDIKLTLEKDSVKAEYKIKF